MNQCGRGCDEGNVELSVIVGFRDWGLERLVGVVRSIKRSFSKTGLEVIIVDYGSGSTEGFHDVLTAEGARYIYVETDGVWSRSRALNIGLGAAKGRYLITTDADMIFSPGSISLIHEELAKLPGVALLLQCRDLPPGITHSYIESDDVDWAHLESISRLRPRWGMGGMIAFESEAYHSIRGLDERMEIYGGEDIDLAKRLARAGYQRVWMSDDRVRMYHVWHEPSRVTADATAEGRAAIARNRDIHVNDQSTIRNIRSWTGRPKKYRPLVTVAISTYNRAGTIRDSILSVVGQSFQDWELIVVDDGSTDNAVDVVNEIDDARIRLIRQKNSGIAASRNRITEEARGRYIAVHDDDDIMLPNRLESSLAAIKGGVNGAYGGWVDFDNRTGDLKFNPGKRVNEESLLFNNSTFLHPTLMVERWLFKEVKYDDSMRSGSDYNLAVRMARSGVRLAHCGEYVLLRRIHDKQITVEDGTVQKSNGALTSFLGRNTMSPADRESVSRDREKKDYVRTANVEDARQAIINYLPDKLVRRSAKLVLEGNDTEGLPVENGDAVSVLEIKSFVDGSFTRKIELHDIDFATLSYLNKVYAGRVEVDSRLLESTHDTGPASSVSANGGGRSFDSELTDFAIDEASRISSGYAALCYWDSDSSPWDRVDQLPREALRIRARQWSGGGGQTFSLLELDSLEELYDRIDCSNWDAGINVRRVIGIAKRGSK